MSADGLQRPDHRPARPRKCPLRTRVGFPIALLLVSLVAAAGPTVTIGGRPVNDWVYQLQGHDGRPLDLKPLAATRYDLAVVDYSADGTGTGEFGPEQVAALRHGSGGEKLALAYMSIGEAEEDRFYWDPAWVDRHDRPTPLAPPWLGPVNPDFRDNFKVRYWDPDWQRIIFGVTEGPQKSYLDRILDQGFDGVYLDIIDGFEFFGPGGKRPERPTAAADMAAFVEAISRYAREMRGHAAFVVVPQNGSEIVRKLDHAGRADYFAAIDAIGAEDTFFFGDSENNNRFWPRRREIRNLRLFQAAGRQVLSVDYVTRRKKIRRYYRETRRHGYVGFATVRALDRPTVNRGFKPDLKPRWRGVSTATH